MDTLKEQGLTHALKKAPGSSKKRKKIGNDSTIPGSNGVESEKITGNSIRTTNGTGTQGIKNASTASLTAKVLAEVEAKTKKRRLDGNLSSQSLSDAKRPKEKVGDDFMTRGFSIPAGARR